MNTVSKNKNHHLNSFINLLILFQGFFFVFPQLLNNIIRLADNGFRYSHFNFNSNGDMIVDNSAFPSSPERRFFGLKNNGRFFFNEETGFYSIYVGHSKGRIEGESSFIKLTSSNSDIHGKELILGISKNSDRDSGYYVELYNLNDKNMTQYTTLNIFGNIISNSFSITKTPDDLNNNYYYTFSYIVCNSYAYYLNIKKLFFSFDFDSGHQVEGIPVSLGVAVQRIVSSFYTKKSIYICFYLNADKHLRINAYNSDFSNSVETSIYDPSNYGENNFFKGIHLKDEIGFFIYFKQNANNPIISILQCNNDRTLTKYYNYEGIAIDKTTFNIDCLLNDIVKLNDFQVCYISINSNKDYFKLVIFTLYKDDSLMNIRYYQIEMWYNYNTKIYFNIKTALYKNFISLAFSHCSDNDCTAVYSNSHFTSLIIFSYPNSTDINLDLIPELYITNKNIENDFNFNFEEAINIENNLFGFTFKGTKIMDYLTGLYLKNGGNILVKESILLKNENATLYFETHENYAKKNYIIEYAYVLTEPKYDDIVNYITSIEDTYGNKIEDEKNYYKNYEYIGKSSYYIIILKEDLITNCKDDSCSLCFKNYTCITCKYNYTFNNNKKTCLSKPISAETSTTTSTITSTNNQIKEIYEQLKGRMSIDSNELIEIENAIFQMSTLEVQKNTNNPNVSSIDLGECEKLLKEQEGLSEDDDLIVLKVDIINEELSSTYVQYEIYNPIKLTLIPLGICNEKPIMINVPITLDENRKSTCDSLCQSGYDLFNLNDSFYNDICTTYTTENGTDLTLSDRKKLIFDQNGNISMCQEGCSFQSYNCTTKKVKCDCSIQLEEIITDVSKINFDKTEIYESFFTTLKNSNFLVLKCYKLVFSIKGQTNNIGSYMMSFFTLIFIILMILYIINGNKKINFFIELILKQKLNNKNKKPIKNGKNKTKYSKHKNIFKINNKENNNNAFQRKNQKRATSQKIKSNFPPKKNNLVKKINSNEIRKSSDGLMNPSQQNIKLYKNANLLDINKKRKNVKNKAFNKTLRNNKNNKINIMEKSNLLDSNKNTNIYIEKYKIKELNDEELNTLEYEKALLIDKRTFFQYYYSLLKKKHLILFAFYPAYDFNLIVVKISLLFLSFSLFFTINGFFFSDKTMNKINEDKGTYNFLFKIPQLFYSTIISAIINLILKTLSLSEKQILTIKLEKNFKVAHTKSKSIKNCIIIKLIIFFIFSFVLMIFFWYFISCFCAVYTNTQLILIEDTLISFALSMIYPFGLNLLPGMFRIPALRAQKKDKKCLYRASTLIALI